MEKERITHVDNQFIFEQGSNNTIINGGTFNGPIYTSPSDACGTPSTAINEEEVLMLLDDLLEMKNGNGSYLMTDKKQWYAVFRVLSEFCNYPAKMSDFCRTMKRMNMHEARVPCVYSSLKDASRGLLQLTCKTTLWQQFRDISDAYQKQCDVASFLLEKLNVG